jgi:hypothetical protein
MPAEISARALEYPFEAPRGSFVQRGTRALELDSSPGDLLGEDRRTALLAYGANASPRALAAKLGASTEREPLPALRASLLDLDVVYSAHVSPYGAVPATLRRSPGTEAAAFVLLATAEQLELLCATEPNYGLASLECERCRLEDGTELAGARAFLSRHGCLRAGGEAVALAAVEARGRALPELAEPEVQALVRDRLEPGRELREFVAEAAADPALGRRRTEALRADALPSGLPVPPSSPR